MTEQEISNKIEDGAFQIVKHYLLSHFDNIVPESIIPMPRGWSFDCFINSKTKGCFIEIKTRTFESDRYNTDGGLWIEKSKVDKIYSLMLASKGMGECSGYVCMLFPKSNNCLFYNIERILEFDNTNRMMNAVTVKSDDKKHKEVYQCPDYLNDKNFPEDIDYHFDGFDYDSWMEQVNVRAKK